MHQILALTNLNSLDFIELNLMFRTNGTSEERIHKKSTSTYLSEEIQKDKLSCKIKILFLLLTYLWKGISYIFLRSDKYFVFMEVCLRMVIQYFTQLIK